MLLSNITVDSRKISPGVSEHLQSPPELEITFQCRCSWTWKLYYHHFSTTICRKANFMGKSARLARLYNVCWSEFQIVRHLCTQTMGKIRAHLFRDFFQPRSDGVEFFFIFLTQPFLRSWSLLLARCVDRFLTLVEEEII